MKSEKGQSMVETALILPIILLLLFGIVDFGRIFHAYLTLDHAGREGARLASIQSEDNVIKDRITASVAGLDDTKLTISIAPAGASTRPSGTDVTITLAYSIDFLTPFLDPLLSPLTLTDITVMRVE